MGSKLSRSGAQDADKTGPPPPPSRGLRRRKKKKKKKRRRSPEFPLAAFLRGEKREPEEEDEEEEEEEGTAAAAARRRGLPGGLLLLRKAGDGASGLPDPPPPSGAPYARRVGWLREIQEALRERRRDEALRTLRVLRKDLGLEGTFLSEVLYKNAAFLNLVDPISHDLLMSLARDLQCPKKEYDPWKSSERICRQLIYHLTPHSKWRRNSLSKRKSHRSLKNNLQKKLTQDAIDLSGIPLSTRDVHHLAYYLQSNGGHLATVDLSFTDLGDDTFRALLPFLWSLPGLTHLSLNGNRLTRAAVKELTDAMKDPAKFPFLAWIDLGNNVDISSMPQPLLVGLRKRLSLQTTLPTIYESLDRDSDEEDQQATAREDSCGFSRRSCER